MALQAMNASPFHPKVKTSIRLGDTLYVAGGVVAGKIQMECKTDKGLGIGVIMVELFAIEELTSRDHSATSTFLHSRRVFQGPGLPPSNAVHPHPLVGEPPLPQDYHPARRGTTTFLFRFPLPASSPSAINFGSGLANVKYEVRASVGVSWKGERRLVTDKKEVDVVESFGEDFSRSDPEGVIVGENGKIWVQGRLIGGVLVAGQPACVELQVKNHSAKKNSGLSITLTRELRLPHFSATEKAPLRISDTLTSVSFRGEEYIIPSGTEGVANLVFDVPSNARGVKGSQRYGDEEDERITECLFEVRCIIGVKLSMGFGSKDIILEIPVTVLHPTALPEIPLPNPHPPYSPMPYNSPPQVPYSLPTSPDPYFGAQQYPLPPMSPANLYIEQEHPGWLPPPVHSPLSYYPHLSPPLPDPLVYYNQPPQGMLYPPLHPHAYPLRPSSAEPIPSHALYALPDGMPILLMQQPLLPLAAASIPPLAEREEGKGERASRISHHLRLSSRHRSVSPRAHRYPIPMTVEDHMTGQPVAQAPASARDIASSSPLPSPPMQLTIPTGLSMSSDVVSPRPMLSPKQSYAVDPLTHATSSKSERVETLERIAAHAEQKFSDMSSNVPEVMRLGVIDKDKTLPVPPAPPQKTKPACSGLAGSRPTAQTLFSPPEVEELLDKTPPTPTLAAVMSLKVPRVAGGRSGLDALEARLLAEVGTRKVEQDDKRPDVRSVLPMSIPRPQGQGDPANDSAISSLNLPALGADEMTKIGKASSAHSGITYRDGERGRARERESGPNQKEVPDGAGSKEKREKKKKDRQGDGRDEEAYRLRKAAQGRIAAWLGTVDPDAPLSPVITRRSTPHEEDNELSITRASGLGFGEPESVEEQPPMAVRSEEDPKVAVAETVAQPNPRSSGFVPIGTLRTNRKDPPSPRVQFEDKPTPLPVNLQKRLPVFPPPPPLDPEVRYDIRSARGGRGGLVTAVAAIWASTSQTANRLPTPPRSSPNKVHKPAAIVANPAGNKAGIKSVPISRPLRTTAKPPAFRSPPSTSGSDNVPNVTSKRAKMAKAASVPAIVSSSLATPMLSSTASLARPAALTTDRTRYKNQVSSGITEIREEAPVIAPKPRPAVHGELAFGQARLKELIKKYQGQTNA